jgi:hypothetical protein
VLRGLIAERVVIKGFGESTSLDSGQVDIWNESQVRLCSVVCRRF